MSADNLITEALAMTLSDRARIANALIRSIEPEKRPLKERFDYLVGVMASVTGRPVEMKSRDGNAPWVRAIISHRLAAEGYSEPAIGVVFRIDHSTVNHQKHNVDTALEFPGMYADVIDIYNRFNKAL